MPDTATFTPAAFDLAAAGLSPMPAQENVDKAVTLFNEKNAALKAFSHTEDSVTGKAAREEILGNENLATEVEKFMAGLSLSVAKFMEENPGSAVFLRDRGLAATLGSTFKARALEDIQDKIAEMASVSDDDTAKRDETVTQLKSDAAALKGYIGNLVTLGGAFGVALEVPELDKISGPRQSNGERKQTDKVLPRMTLDGNDLPAGTTFYNAVKAMRNAEGDKEEWNAAIASAQIRARGQKWGKDECVAEFGGHTLIVHPVK